MRTFLTPLGEPCTVKDGALYDKRNKILGYLSKLPKIVGNDVFVHVSESKGTKEHRMMVLRVH